MTSSVCSTEGAYAYDPNIQALWTTTVADIDAPTEAEVTGATLLNDTYCLTDIIGWEVQTEIIRDPPWGVFEKQRVGGKSVADSGFIFAADRSGNDIRTLFSRGDVGYVMLLPSGPYTDYPSAPINVYDVRVAQITQRQRLRTGEGSLLIVQFAINAVGENVTVV